MKKKLRLLCILMVLVLSLGLLSACGGEEPVSLVGNWDCDDYETSLVFYDDGTADMSDYYDYAVVDYEWDGETLTLSYDGDTLQGVLGEDGSLVVDGDIVFVRVEAITYYPADPGDEGDEPVRYDMTDSAWDVEGGWYSRGDSSQLTYPDITGPEAEMVGQWVNSYTGDSVEFTRDGSVVYSIGGGFGVASPFTFDGETVTFSDYTGYIDGDGDLIVEGLDGWFSRSESSGGDSGSGDSGYALGGAYDNDDAEMSIVFHSDGTATVSDFYSSEDATYTVDGDYLVVEFDSGGYYEAYYDSSDDTFQVDGLDGWFYYVGEAWYTPD